MDLDATSSRGDAALAGMRVLDMSRVLAGPYCTQFLGEMGADVIKVESPGRGDDTRSWGPPFVGEKGRTESVYFLGTNRNKRGVAVDLSSPGGQEIIRKLAVKSDVVVENFRPGTLERWGLGYSDLAALNERLIHVAISGFGQTGRYRDRAGYDLVTQGVSGLMSITGSADGPPTKVGLPVADMNAGTWAIVAVLMALEARHRTGRGQYIDISLLETQLAWHTFAAGMYLYNGTVQQRMGNAHPIVAPYQAYETQDGWINIAIGSDRLWQLFSAELGLELGDDDRFDHNAGRIEHLDELNRLLEPLLRQRSAADWLARLDAVGIPAGPINSMDAVYADPWINERDQVVRLPHPTIGEYKGTGFPFKASMSAIAPRLAPPLHGQHTREVLGELGYDEAAISTLIENRTVEASTTE